MTTENEQQPEQHSALIAFVTAAALPMLLIGLIVVGVGLLGAQSTELARSVELRATGLATSVGTGVREQGNLMGLPLDTSSHAFWYLARAGGVMAYLLLWMATCWGIVMSSKLGKGYLSAPVAFALHDYLPILGLVFAGLHAVVLLGDSYVNFDLTQLLIPFTSSYKPLWTGLGILSFYLLLAIIVSSYLRKQIGQRTWRAFHYASYVGFLMALAHGIFAGTDSNSLLMRTLYLTTGATCLFLVYYRLLSYAPKAARARTQSRSIEPAPGTSGE